MKKRFDLQLFAEEAATDAAAAPAAEQAEEPAKPEPAPAAVLKEKGAKYTDADVDEILNRKFAEWQKKQQKAVDEAQKLATMNATQKAEYERDQLKKGIRGVEAHFCIVRNEQNSPEDAF